MRIIINVGIIKNEDSAYANIVNYLIASEWKDVSFNYLKIEDENEVSDFVISFFKHELEGDKNIQLSTDEGNGVYIFRHKDEVLKDIFSLLNIRYDLGDFEIINIFSFENLKASFLYGLIAGEVFGGQEAIFITFNMTLKDEAFFENLKGLGMDALDITNTTDGLEIKRIASYQRDKDFYYLEKHSKLKDYFDFSIDKLNSLIESIKLCGFKYLIIDSSYLGISMIGKILNRGRNILIGKSFGVDNELLGKVLTIEDNSKFIWKEDEVYRGGVTKGEGLKWKRILKGRF